MSKCLGAMSKMILFSWNINGYNTCNRYGGFSTILNDEPAFICLQEVKIGNPDTLYNFFTCNYFHYYNFSSKKGRNGVYILSKQKAKDHTKAIGFDRFDEDGRFLCLEYEDYYIINVYMPHGGRDKTDMDYKKSAYYHLFEFLKNLNGKNIILTGDFNIAHSPLDLERDKYNHNNTMFTDCERNLLTQLTKMDMIDVFRYLHPCKKEYTWWPYAFDARNKDIGWRIDYFFVSNSIIHRVKDIKLKKDILGSDHCPLALDVDLVSQ